MDYAFGAHTLLAGETGSAKTSLIDAIVAVMAGGDTRKSKFNTAQTQNCPSAKEKQAHHRFLHRRQQCMGRFLRANGAHGYVCVSWAQDEGDGSYALHLPRLSEAKRALIGMSKKQPLLNGELVRILVRGHVVGHADLLAIRRHRPAGK